MKTSRNRTTLMAALAALAIHAGCGSEEPAEVEPIQSGERRIIHSEKPSGEKIELEVVGQGALPADFPRDLPTYPGADPAGSMSIPGAMQFIAFTSEDGVEEVIGFYRKKLPNEGWRIESESASPPSIVAAKGGRKAYIRVQRDGASTSIGISLEGRS